MAEPLEGMDPPVSKGYELFKDFLERDDIFVELALLKQKGWENKSGDGHFEKQKEMADKSDHKGKRRFFNVMVQVGDEMQAKTNAIEENRKGINLLDICMAPGGLTTSILKRHKKAFCHGLTLPVEDGGHELFFLSGLKSRINVIFTDITLLAAELGVSRIPEDHPEPSDFVMELPLGTKTFDAVIADGQVLRKQLRKEWRNQGEASRLTRAQLIIALQHIKPGGTFICLLHKIDAWYSVDTLYNFSRSSDIQLFKPQKKHALRSSFYLVAKNVRVESPGALQTLETWKMDWNKVTFGNSKDTVGYLDDPAESHVKHVVSTFGPQYFQLARPIWSIQAQALKEARFMKLNVKGSISSQ